MSESHNIEYALDCEGGERSIFFLLKGRTLQVTVLELRDPNDSGPDWTGATGELEFHDCEMAVEELHELIADYEPESEWDVRLLELRVNACLFAWRNTNEDITRFKAQPGLIDVDIHIESLRDAKYLERQLQDFMRLLRR